MLAALTAVAMPKQSAADSATSLNVFMIVPLIDECGLERSQKAGPSIRFGIPLLLFPAQRCKPAPLQRRRLYSSAHALLDKQAPHVLPL
jgi:hypothetical protein